MCISAQANEWDFDSASALNRFDHHGFSRSSLMEQFLRERRKQQQQLDDYDYDLKFLPYSAQAGSTRLKWNEIASMSQILSSFSSLRQGQLQRVSLSTWWICHK